MRALRRPGSGPPPARHHRRRALSLSGPTHPGKHWYVVPEVGFPHEPTFSHSYAALAEALDGRIDWATTVIGGFSQGTVMSYALALGAGRPVPAGVLAMSGFVPTVEGWQADLAARSQLPVLIAHGTQDPVIGIAFARQARALLEAGGLPVEVHESPMSHTIDPRVLPAVSDWLRLRFGGGRSGT